VREILPDLKSHSTSMVSWKAEGRVAEEKFTLFKSISASLNLFEYIRTEDVLAVPDLAFCQKVEKIPGVQSSDISDSSGVISLGFNLVIL